MKSKGLQTNWIDRQVKFMKMYIDTINSSQRSDNVWRVWMSEIDELNPLLPKGVVTYVGRTCIAKCEM